MTPTALFELNGKTALVTGGATGIGQDGNNSVAAAGARVFIASRKIDACRATADESIAWVLQAVCMPCRGMSQQKMALSN